MSWVEAFLAFLSGVAVAALTPTLLRHLPVPDDEPTSPYSPLATPGFQIATFLAVTTGLLMPLLFDRPHALAWAGLSTAGVVAALIDARTCFLPRRLIQAGWVLAAVGVAATGIVLADPNVPIRAWVGAAAGFALFYAFWRFGRGFGFGDVRLAPLVGGTAGAVSWDFLFWSFLLASLAGVLWGICSRIILRGRAFPYGPALVLGPFLALGKLQLTGG